MSTVRAHLRKGKPVRSYTRRSMIKTFRKNALLQENHRNNLGKVTNSSARKYSRWGKAAGAAHSRLQAKVKRGLKLFKRKGGVITTANRITSRYYGR